MAGTMMKPPPTPMMAASTPTARPTRKGGITLMYSPDLRNLTRQGSPSIQLRPRLRGLAVPRREARRLATLSRSMVRPMKPRNTT